MNKNRYFLCLLLCGLMLYYGLPNLPSQTGDAAGVFSISWLIFALFVMAGNLSALLFTRRRPCSNKQSNLNKAKRKVREYH
jgi:hypothetical protein